MSEALERSAAAGDMDRMYRYQRYIYDLTRKHYLLGRDRLIEDLDPPPRGNVLEIACGTGRNLVQAARRYPQAMFCGLDVSAAMLDTARHSIDAAGLAQRIRLEQADATDFDPGRLFGVASFDRIFISYALSMIPDWRGAVSCALRSLAPGGSLHVVDFGQQERLPGWFRSLLRAWLAKFHVTPRADLAAGLAILGAAAGQRLRFVPLYRGYAYYAVLSRGDEGADEKSAARSQSVPSGRGAGGG